MDHSSGDKKAPLGAFFVTTGKRPRYYSRRYGTYSFARVMVPLALGNIVFNVGLAYLSLHAYTFVHAVFIG